MKKYILSQPILVKQDIDGSNVNNYWDTVIRVVYANNKEEALGKFMLQTQHIVAKEKLNPLCYLLDELIELN